MIIHWNETIVLSDDHSTIFSAYCVGWYLTRSWQDRNIHEQTEQLNQGMKACTNHISWWDTQQAASSRAWSSQLFRGRREGGQPLNSALLAPHEWLAPRASQSDYRALWWGAPQAADPPTPGPEKHQKSFTLLRGKLFGRNPGRPHKSLQEHSPPVLRALKIGKKCCFDRWCFGRFLAFRN